MGTEIDHASTDIQSNLTTNPSTASTSATKTSMFAKRTGFVIPKNKLSGSLVRVHKGTRKGDGDLVNEEANKQSQRRTKWGPDLTMDPTVRKGRALAYQTRINQIAQQLTLRVLELEDNEDSYAASDETPHHELSHEDSVLLDLEKREIIGELLKLNPTYKAPADYKPLLKEAKVPIPIKEFPGYNFVGLLFGHSNSTQKRIEKETGAKVQVYGTKKGNGGKVEITPTDEKEIENTCEDMYVHVSADTFEKVDAAVALIELLVTPVSVNPVSSSKTSTSVPDDNMNAPPNQSRSSSFAAPPPMNTQTYTESLSLPQGHFQQYPQPWFSSAGPTQLGLVPPPNISSLPFKTPSFFAPQPVIPASFSPVFQNQPPFVQQAPSLVQTGGPRNTSMPVLHSPTTQPLLSLRPPMSISPQFAPVPPSSQNIISGGPNRMISPLSGPPQPSGTVTIRQSTNSMPFPMQSPQPRFPNFDSVRPVSTAISRPSSSDFTFQPHRPPNAATPQLWQSNQATQSPLLRPTVHNMNSSAVQDGFSRPQGMPGPHMGPPRHHPMMPVPMGSHMQPRNFLLPHQISNPPSPFPPRPGNQMHIQEIHLARPQRFLTPQQQQFGNHPHPGRPFFTTSVAQQTYDPFSPTSPSHGR